MNLDWERNECLRKPLPNLADLMTSATGFDLSIQNRYSLLSDEKHINIDQIYIHFINIIEEGALKISGKNNQFSSQVSVGTKQLMLRHRGENNAKYQTK